MLNKFLFNLNHNFPNLYKHLSRYIQWNDGLIEEEISVDDYIFGGDSISGKEILQPDGQWLDISIADEVQRKGNLETMNCTNFALANGIELLHKRKYGFEINVSDRFMGKMSGVTSRGNSPRISLDSLRNNGTVEENTWTWLDDVITWNQYYCPISAEVISLGQDFVKKYDFGYEMVYGNYSNAIMDGLKYSPIYVSGYAWAKDGEYYRSYGAANHQFLIIGYIKDKCWFVKDSYSPFVKQLAWNFEFVNPRVLYLKARNNAEQILEGLLAKGIKYVMRTDSLGGGRGQVYEITEDGLKELNENDKMDKEEKQQVMNAWIKEQLTKKTLTGITETFYKNINS